MKSLPLLLSLAFVVLFQTSASAQSLSKSADKLENTLSALSQTVDAKLGKDERRELAKAVDKARGDAQELRDLAASNAPRLAVADRLVKLREHVGEAQRQLGAFRDRDSLRAFSYDINTRMGWVEQAWVASGQPRGGYYVAPAGPSLDVRASNLAARELSNNLRVPISAVTITRLEPYGDRYRAYASVRGAGRYVVDLNPTTERIFSTVPVR